MESAPLFYFAMMDYTSGLFGEKAGFFKVQNIKNQKLLPDIACFVVMPDVTV